MKTIQFKISDSEYETYKMLLKEQYKWRSYFISDAIEECRLTYLEFLESGREPYWKEEQEIRKKYGLHDH